VGKIINPFDRFTRASVENNPPKQRLIGLSIGEDGSRKTSFWLEGPGPVCVFSLDRGLEHVVDRYQDEKEVYVKEYDWNAASDSAQDDAIAIRDEFLLDYQQALEHARTILIDKETDLWELFRFAEFGAPNDNPKNYEALNTTYRKIFADAKSSDVNLGCIERLKDKWGMQTGRSGTQSLGRSGERVRQGFGELAGIVHLVLTHVGVGPESWAVQVGKVRGPGALNVAEETYSFAAVPDFKTFAQMLFPDTDEEDWQ
jgi:hypothetical protein